VQICDDLARVPKRETPIELQSVSARRNAWMLLFHSRKKTSNAQRLTSNAEMKESAGTFGVRRWDLPRHSLANGFGVFFTFFGRHLRKSRPFSISEKIFETFSIGSGENK
jgi:hypothetical protein